MVEAVTVKDVIIWATSWQSQQNDWAPSEDSDQPRHSPSLIRVFAVRMKKAWVLSYPLSAQQRLRSDWAGWSESSLDAQSFCWFFLSWGGSNTFSQALVISGTGFQSFQTAANRLDWSESSLCAQWVAKDPSSLHTNTKDFDQTGRMPKLIWVFAGRTCHFVGFVMRRLIIWN